MSAIEHLTIALSAQAADSIRARVASGDYQDEGAVIEEALRALKIVDDEIASIVPEVSEEEEEDWLKTEVVAIMEEHERDPTDVLSVEEVLESLAAARKARSGA